MAVVDANAAVAWAVDLPWSQRAVALRDTRQRLAAPTLLLSEVGDALWRNQRAGFLSEREAILAYRQIPTCIDLIADQTLQEQALALAFRLQHPIYDCFYLSQAEELGETLFTADRRLAAVARSYGKVAVESLLDPA